MPWKKILKKPNPYDDFMFWWWDEYVRWYLHWYYLPHYIAGKQDEWTKLGITLNGVKPICKP